MKKKLYYVMPFAVVSTLMCLCELMDNLGLIPMSPFILVALMLLSSAVFGFFSSSDRLFDYLMTLITPLSLFCFMFIIGFLGKNDLSTRFHLYKAFNAAFQPIALVLYFGMATVTLLASCKYFRKLKNHSKNH